MQCLTGCAGNKRASEENLGGKGAAKGKRGEREVRRAYPQLSAPNYRKGKEGRKTASV